MTKNGATMTDEERNMDNVTGHTLKNVNPVELYLGGKIRLPEVGSDVAAKEECCAVESVKAASDIYAPVSGEVIEVNEALDDEPELLNDSPYEGGWIFRIKASDLSELDDLLSADAYNAQVED